MVEHQEIVFKDGELVRSKSYRFAAELYDTISSVVSAVIGVAIILTFIFKVASVEGQSMVPTLQDQDKLIITNVDSKYEYGDIVVIHRENDVSLVKRVIATEGQMIDIDFEQGVVFIDGIPLEEDYVLDGTHLQFSDGPNFPFVVPNGYLFCMGDNRNNSLDSRSRTVGLINEQYVVGKMILNINELEGNK